jgi:hypothetical protein
MFVLYFFKKIIQTLWFSRIYSHGLCGSISNTDDELLSNGMGGTDLTSTHRRVLCCYTN